jgi:hypothetical protein
LHQKLLQEATTEDRIATTFHQNLPEKQDSYPHRYFFSFDLIVILNAFVGCLRIRVCVDVV